MDPEDIANCKFVPLSALQRAVDFLETCQSPPVDNKYCMKNLFTLQKSRSINTLIRSTNSNRNNFHLAIHRAIYAHDWNKLLYLLKKSPIYKQNTTKVHGLPFYVRALTILLMQHPSAQSQKLLVEYIHMVCSCRSEEEQKALMKMILTLPEKFVERYMYLYQMKHNKYRDDNY